MAKAQPKTGQQQAAAGDQGGGDPAVDPILGQDDSGEAAADSGEAAAAAPPAAPAAPAAPTPAAAAPAVDPFADLIRESTGRKDQAAFLLLLEACERFGVDPRTTKKPVELLAWRFYPGNYDHFNTVPDAVVLVTAGGVKVKHYEDPDYPMDPDTLENLRRLFGCYHQDPKTKEIVVDPLPADLALPAASVTGQVLSTDHQYRGGYLKAGGKTAADERDRRRAERAERFTK